MLKYTLSMRWLRWVLLALYLALILSLAGLALFDGGDGFTVVVLLVLMFGSQALFLLGSGKLELSRPLRGLRLAIPAAVAGLMLAILIGGAGLALLELLEPDADWVFMGWLALVPVSWIVWSLLLYIYCRGQERFTTIGRLTGLLFAGSLAALMVSIPAHIIVSRRPGLLRGNFDRHGHRQWGLCNALVLRTRNFAAILEGEAEVRAAQGSPACCGPGPRDSGASGHPGRIRRKGREDQGQGGKTKAGRPRREDQGGKTKVLSRNVVRQAHHERIKNTARSS